MVKIAFVFPGQGSQFIGMGKDFYDHVPEAKKLFEEANEVLGYDLASICFNGPEESLKLTENTQPALLVHSTMALKMIRENGINSVLAAGHSLGEFSALVAAGALKFRDAVRLVRLRGQFMQEAVPVGVGSMAAIIGLPVETIQELCDKVSSDSNLVQPANLNSPVQTVIAGHKESVDRVSKDALAAGAKKAVVLPVSAPFHSALMKPAEVKLQKELEDTEFYDLSFPIINNIEAKPITKGIEARESLVKQVCSPVRWAETMQSIIDHKINTVIELGSGKVLSGLMKRFDKSVNCYQVSDRDSLSQTLSALN
ncbi:MAG: ACP S-malonyltransferase [Nitrospinae bacterium]|nr:ACP S-malonyltransferase [Nitrospinota bacterium]MZH04212.1 ACP S-malonyltransferase [Nitrospinota bacterium]MZH14194.1 ACP S-malonyltransferase [Nitrospinota bacterium]